MTIPTAYVFDCKTGEILSRHNTNFHDLKILSKKKKIIIKS